MIYESEFTGAEIDAAVTKVNAITPTPAEINSGIRPYKVYAALLTQSGTNAPVITVLENTIGDIVWSYLGVGSYRASLLNAFDKNKTQVFITPCNLGETNVILSYTVHVVGIGDYITFCSLLSGVYSNDQYKNSSIEIRVYQ